MEAAFKLEFKSEKDAQTALTVMESERIERERSSVKFKVKGKTLEFEVKAKDFAALRAAVNTYLRLAATIMYGVEE